MSDLLYRINSDREKPWNELPALPIREELYREVGITEQLGEAKIALGRLQGRSIAIPNQALLINTISLQEAKASSAIENIFTTDDELYKAYSEQGYEGLNGSPKEVLRYREALWSGYHYLKANGQFDATYFIKTYREIKQVNDGFRLPFAQIVIRAGASGPQAGKVIYTPPRGRGIIEDKMENLIAFTNDDEAFPGDQIIKMAIGHFQFEAIHPFSDGNGRTGRIFNIHYLVHKGLLDYPILFMSRYIIDHKDEYYARLAGVSQRGDWKSWLLFMLKAVEVTANITYQKINDILSTRDAIMEIVEQETAIRRPEQLVQMIFLQPFTKVKHLTDSKIYAENTARAYLNKLSEMGILEKRQVEGHHYYMNVELYRILSQ